MSRAQGPPKYVPKPPASCRKPLSPIGTPTQAAQVAIGGGSNATDLDSIGPADAVRILSGGGDVRGCVSLGALAPRLLSVLRDWPGGRVSAVLAWARFGA